MIGGRGQKKQTADNNDEQDDDDDDDDAEEEEEEEDGMEEDVEEMKKNLSEAQKGFWEDKGKPREYNDETAPPLHEFWAGKKAGAWKQQTQRAIKGPNKQTGCVCVVGEWHFGNPMGGRSGTYSFHCKTSDPTL